MANHFSFLPRPFSLWEQYKKYIILHLKMLKIGSFMLLITIKNKKKIKKLPSIEKQNVLYT